MLLSSRADDDDEGDDGESARFVHVMDGWMDAACDDLLWLNVYELSRLLSCCKRACIIPALLRDTGRV